MATEIERKYLPKDPDWRPTGKPKKIVQGYFWMDETATAHIASGPRQAFTFVLKMRDARNAPEWKLKLPAQDGKELLAANPHSLSNKWTVRVRRSDEDGFLTIKGPASEDNTTRPEYEYPLNKSETSMLLDLCQDTHVIKDRYEIPFKRRLWEVDVYGGHLEGTGLVTCEIELRRADLRIPLPPWVGEDVTQIKGYSNASMARRLPLPVRPK